MLTTPEVAAFGTRIVPPCEIVSSLEVILDQPIVRTAAELGQLQHANADIGPLINVLERSESPLEWNELAD
jgi:hypothetical protein